MLVLLTTVMLAGANYAASHAHAGQGGTACPSEAAVLLDTMEAELGRSMENLGGESIQSPYFISYRLRERTTQAVRAKFGAVFTENQGRTRQVAADVRVGDYGFDSSGISTMDFDRIPDYFPEESVPLDDDPAALRHALWLLTDRHYKEAVAAYGRRQGQRVFRIEDDKADSFSQEKPLEQCTAIPSFQFDHGAHARRARQLSRLFITSPEIFDSEVRINAEQEVVYFVNSEGTRTVREQTLYSVSVVAVTRAEDGMLLQHSHTEYAPSQDEILSSPALEESMQRLIVNLLALRKAPVIEPYTGPAILEPEATGVFFHETVGHRLEGERQGSESEGRTFKGRVGERIIPEFLTLVDDPQRQNYQGIPLNGFYPFDDEGVLGQTVTLIDNGILKGFLMSRTPIENFPSSTGHGRAQGTRRPIARMSNLMVLSSRVMSYPLLKEELLRLVQETGRPYGLIIADISGGSTNTAAYGYQAFKGTPQMVYRIDGETGERELVRGVEMVGTPLTAINSIVATADTYEVFNGFCGAESGFVPVSTIAPASLFREIELQRVQSSKERGPLLPTPPRN